MSTVTDRQAFREAVATVAAKAKAILPISTNGRVESAVKLVLLDEVQPQADGSIQVGSCSDASKVYHLVGSTCDCQDYSRAPAQFCKHRIAAGIQKRVQEALAAASPRVETAPVYGNPHPPLPEAACSANVHVQIAGRDVLLTLRGDSEAEVLRRMAAVLEQYPLPTTAGSAPAPVCPYHGPLKPSTKGKGWYCPAKMVDGSYCKEKGQ
jgi:hypothetical protein